MAKIAASEIRGTFGGTGENFQAKVPANLNMHPEYGLLFAAELPYKSTIGSTGDLSALLHPRAAKLKLNDSHLLVKATKLAIKMHTSAGWLPLGADTFVVVSRDPLQGVQARCLRLHPVAHILDHRMRTRDPDVLFAAAG